MERRAFVSAALGGLAGVAGCAAPTAEEPTVTADDETDGTTVAGNETAAGTTTGATTAAAGPQEVAMITDGNEFYFDPIGLFVEPGSTVTWVDESGAHSATAYAEGTGGAETTRIPADAEPWNSDVISSVGATFEHTFEVPGTYDYFCIPHKALGMVGRVVVGGPGGPAEGSMPPDGEVPESGTIVREGAVSYEEFAG